MLSFSLPNDTWDVPIKVVGRINSSQYNRAKVEENKRRYASKDYITSKAI